jgi:hypothetical protein
VVCINSGKRKTYMKQEASFCCLPEETDPRTKTQFNHTLIPKKAKSLDFLAYLAPKETRKEHTQGEGNLTADTNTWF